MRTRFERREGEPKRPSAELCSDPGLPRFIHTGINPSDCRLRMQGKNRLVKMCSGYGDHLRRKIWGNLITMKIPDVTERTAVKPIWCCLRSQPKHEHIAAANLRQMVKEIEVFSPKLRIRRQTRRGPVWFVEALFPGYLFARFDPGSSMQSVKCTPGITTVVSFGLLTPSIPDEVIEELRVQFGQNNLQEVGDDVQPGDEITVASGPFQGFSANVLRVLPAADRVQVLLEILGRIIPVDLSRDHVLTQKPTAQRLVMANPSWARPDTLPARFHLGGT